MQLLLRGSILFAILSLLIAKKMYVCDIKEQLVKARDQGNLNGEVRAWLCLIYRDTYYSYTTIKNGRYGLFQIQSPTWCEVDEVGGKCNKNCNDFLNTNLTDDIACAQKIYNTDRPGTDRDGFAYWEIWRNECEGKNLSNYGKECTGIYLPGWQLPLNLSIS